ncbi:MAG: carbamoyl phosphate synthase large subunit, partial [Deltaproteobacteria bacterium]|nr:carbamoyl phosphate synthase large subunit [Deltaproteobacteria bacterium]
KMEHIEEAGIHSGDSSCSIPPYSLPREIIREIEKQTELLARELNIIGLINCQFAVKDGRVYILEVNPRASRTVPFVSKSIGVPIAKVAARVILGGKLKDMDLKGKPTPAHTAIKVPVFPFLRFPGIDTLLGPEMKSTGEVMGIDRDFPSAFFKGWIASGNSLRKGGAVFISVKDADKEAAAGLAKGFLECGFRVVSTRGTAGHLAAKGVEVEVVNKVREGRPHIVDILYNGEISLVVNTPTGRQSVHDSYSIRRTSLIMGVPIITTISGARAALAAISGMRDGEMGVKAIQEYLELEAAR